MYAIWLVSIALLAVTNPGDTDEAIAERLLNWIADAVDVELVVQVDPEPTETTEEEESDDEEDSRDDKDRIEVEVEERETRGGSGIAIERIANQLREQAERIERLETEVRRLRAAGPREDRPRATDRSPEARVRELERGMERLRERARNGDGGNEARRDRSERRNRGAEVINRQLELFRSKRAEAQKSYNEQREQVAREMQRTMERLEQGFKQADEGMERAIAALEQRLVQLQEESGGDGEREQDRD